MPITANPVETKHLCNEIRLDEKIFMVPAKKRAIEIDTNYNIIL